MLITYDDNKKKSEIKKYSIYALIAVIVGLFQITFLPFFSISGILPDLLLILCIWFTLSEGQFSGLIFAFCVGIFYDIISLDVIGTTALAKITASLIAGWFYGENKVQRNLGTYFFIIFIFLTSFFNNIIYYFLHIEFSKISFASLFFQYGLAISIYTSVIAFIPMLLKFRKSKIIR